MPSFSSLAPDYPSPVLTFSANLQERRYSEVTESLERKLVQFESQFQQSRRELDELRGQLDKTQEALQLTKNHLITEQAQTKKLVEVSKKLHMTCVLG